MIKQYANHVETSIDAKRALATSWLGKDRTAAYCLQVCSQAKYDACPLNARDCALWPGLIDAEVMPALHGCDRAPIAPSEPTEAQTFSYSGESNRWLSQPPRCLPATAGPSAGAVLLYVLVAIVVAFALGYWLCSLAGWF